MRSKQKLRMKGTAIGRALLELMFREEGSALIEATLIAPILVAMGAYTADFGLQFYTKMQVQNAAQAGAQWAMANRIYNSAAVQIAGTNATPLSGVTITSSQFCGCSQDSSGNPVVTSLAAGACTSAPNTTCNTTSGVSGVEGNYVNVTATKSPYNSFVPFGLIASTYTISATSTARIQ
jgi:Flp pilus assembly protein TadG